MAAADPFLLQRAVQEAAAPGGVRGWLQARAVLQPWLDPAQFAVLPAKTAVQTAWILALGGQSDAALVGLRLAGRQHPQLLAEAAQIAALTGWSSEQAQLLREALQALPDDIGVWRQWLALVALRDDAAEVQLAAAALDRLSALQPEEALQARLILASESAANRGCNPLTPSIPVAVAEGDLALAWDLATTGADADSLAWRARLRLWSADVAGAGADATAALQADPTCPVALLVAGICAHLQGQADLALASWQVLWSLPRSLSNADDQAEARLWHAEALLHAGQTQQAVAEVERAVASARRSLPAAHLLRWLLLPNPPTAASVDAFVPIVMALFPHLDPAAQPWQDVADAVPAALQALGNNRSGWPTRQIALASAWQGPGGQSIQRMWLPRSPRQQCRRAQELLYHAPVESALAGLNHVAATCPWSPLPLAFRGELYLWLGDFAAAEADLRQALDRWPWTRWAHAGLAAAALHGGAVQQAINWLDLGRDRMKSEGPPWRVLRGEAALQTGDAGEALPLLAEAVRVQPTRIAARWLLALAQVQAGNSAAAEVTAAELASGAPGLWQTALVAAQRQVPEPTLLVVLQAGLLLLRGCRASSFSVHARPDGQGARTIRWQPGQDQRLAAHALRRLQQLGREATP